MDSSLRCNSSRIKMYMNGHWMQGRVKKIQLISLADTLDLQDSWIHGYGNRCLSFLQMADHTMVIVKDKVCLQPDDSTRVKVDYILLQENTSITLEELLHFFDTKCVIADMSNAKWKVRRWKDEAVVLNISFLDTSEKGAFAVQWK